MLKNKTEKQLTVNHPLGLHARPAGVIAKLASQASSNVWLHKNGKTADATSIIDILSLECGPGSQLTVTVDSPEDAWILDSLSKLFASNFEGID